MTQGLIDNKKMMVHKKTLAKSLSQTLAFPDCRIFSLGPGDSLQPSQVCIKGGLMEGRR